MGRSIRVERGVNTIVTHEDQGQEGDRLRRHRGVNRETVMAIFSPPGAGNGVVPVEAASQE